MGVPLGEVEKLDAAAANNELGADFFDAPLRLQTESYESFAQLLHSSAGQDGVQRASVADELRRLGMDPEVFYGNAERLRVREHNADDLDPTSGTGRSSAAPTTLAPPKMASLAALLASDGDASQGAAATDMGASDGGFNPPARSSREKEIEEHLARNLRLKSSGGEPCDAAREKEIEEHHIGTDADTACELGMCPSLHVPDGAILIEAPEFEEILLDPDVEEETVGGRTSCETPCGLEGKLQIDSLTDDEDDDDLLKTDPTEASARVADEEDEIEAFTLDPDFDYDKVDNLSRRL